MRPFLVSASAITLFLALIAHVQATPLPRSNDFPVLPRHVQVAGIDTTPFDGSIGHSIRSKDSPFDPSILSARGEPTDLTKHLEALKTEAERLLEAKQVVELNRKLSEVRGFYPNPLAHHGDSADDKHKPYPKDIQDHAKKIYDDLVAKLDDRVKKNEIIRITPDVEPPEGFKIQRTTTLHWIHNFFPQAIPYEGVTIKQGYTAQSLVDAGEKCLAEAVTATQNIDRNIIVRWQLIMLAGDIVRRSGREDEFKDLLKKLGVACEDEELHAHTKERLEIIHKHYSQTPAGTHHPASRR